MCATSLEGAGERLARVYAMTPDGDVAEDATAAAGTGCRALGEERQAVAHSASSEVDGKATANGEVDERRRRDDEEDDEGERVLRDPGGEAQRRAEDDGKGAESGPRMLGERVDTDRTRWS